MSLAPSLDAHDLREPEGSRRIVVQLPVVLGWGSLLRARGVRIGVALGAAGAVVVALLTGSAAVADATGTAGLFVPVDAQLVKSAEGIGVPQGAFAPYTPQLVQVTGAAGIPTTDVAAVALTVVSVNPTSAGQMSAGPGTGTLSGVMRYTASGSTSNAAIVAVDENGQIQLQTTTSTNVAVHVEGYYTAGNGTAAAGGYTSVKMTRIVDTFNGVGLPKAPIAGGQTVTIQVTGKAGVPTGASAAFVNFQVDNNSGVTGYINPYATSATTRPPTVLNFPATPAYTSIGAIVPIDANGTIHVYVAPSNNIGLLMDVEGYFSAPNGSTTPGAFTPAIAKVYDTRSATHIAPGATVNIPLAGVAGIPSMKLGLSAAVLNLTVIDNSTNGGYARAWAHGTPEPTGVGDLTFKTGTETNLMTVPIGADGSIDLHNVSSDTVDFILDLEGWYATATPIVSCPSPYTYHSWTTTIPAAPVSCTITVPAAAGDTLTYSVDDADEVSTVLSGTGPTSIAVSVDAVGGEHVITATHADATGNELSTRYAFTLGDWRDASWAGLPANTGTASTTPVLVAAIDANDPHVLPDAAGITYTISASANLSNPVVVSDPLWDGFTVPTGLLVDGGTYFWHAAITGPIDYAGHTGSLTTPTWSFTASSTGTENDPTAGDDTPAASAPGSYLEDPDSSSGVQAFCSLHLRLLPDIASRAGTGRLE